MKTTALLFALAAFAGCTSSGGDDYPVATSDVPVGFTSTSTGGAGAGGTDANEGSGSGSGSGVRNDAGVLVDGNEGHDATMIADSNLGSSAAGSGSGSAPSP